MKHCTIETQCRVCGGELVNKLELGQMPLVNRVVHPKDTAPEPSFPLTLAACASCDLVQLRETVDPKILFGESYPYYSSSSRQMVEAMAHLAHEMVKRASLAAWGDDVATERPLRVLEIASNDGYLLQHYRAMGHKVVGIEPAEGPAKVADERGIPTWNRFFSGNPAEVKALQVAAGPAFDVIHAHNVVAHVANVVPFFKGIRELLTPKGLFVIEVPDLAAMLTEGAFDQIYHEHVFYFSIGTLATALAKAGLYVHAFKVVPLHGGSLRVVAQKEPKTDAPLVFSDRAQDLMPVFARSVERQSDWLRAAVLTMKEAGKRVAAYGASAKGCVRLMQARLDSSVIDFVADRTEAKVGRLMPGVRIPILAAQELERRRPDVALLLTWNFEAEIRKEQAGYLRAGGRFLNPLTGKLS